MKILHISDFHYRLPWFDWLVSQAPLFDGIVLAGDLLDQFNPAIGQIAEISRRLAAFPCTPTRPLFVCSGNHDTPPSGRGSLGAGKPGRSGDWLRALARPGLIVDEQTWPGPPVIGVAPWAGRPTAPWTWPEAAAIVVVHAPPAGTALSVGPGSARDDGDNEVRDAILDYSPRLVLSGHVHASRRWHATLGDTLCLNPGCDLGASIPRHIVIDTLLGFAEWHRANAEACERICFAPIPL